MLYYRFLVWLVAFVCNALGRRSDGRTLAGASALVLGGGLLWSVVRIIGASSDPELGYFFAIGWQLVGVIVAVLIVIAVFTWLAIEGVELGGRPVLRRNFVLFVSWHFLRSHREADAEETEEPLRKTPPRGHLLAWLALCGAALGTAYGVPWTRALGLYSLGPVVDAALPAVRWTLWVELALLLSWLPRRQPTAPRRDALDALREVLRPFARSVTATTFISIVGVGVGVWALVVVLSVMGGFECDLRAKILSTNPHVVVQDEEPTTGIPAIHDVLSGIRAIPGVAGALPYVQGDVIVSSSSNRNVSLELKGLDPALLPGVDHHLNRDLVAGDLRNLDTPELIVPTGRWLLRIEPGAEDDTPAGPDGAPDGDDDIEPAPLPGTEGAPDPSLDEEIRPGILLGQELASSLHVGVGQEVMIISPRDDAGFLGIQPRARAFRVAGIFHTGMYEFDYKLAYCSMSEAQRFFHMGADVNRIEVRLKDVNEAGRVGTAIAALLPPGSLEVRDWKHLNKNLFSALALEKIVMFVVLGFIILVASFNIAGSLVMIILEKAKEIAILRSMGTASRSVHRMFLSLGGFIGLIGSTAGVVLGLSTCAFIRWKGIQLPRQYYIERLPVNVDPMTIGLVFLAGIGICLLMTLYPAREASRLEPVEGLRYE